MNAVATRCAFALLLAVGSLGSCRERPDPRIEQTVSDAESTILGRHGGGYFYDTSFKTLVLAPLVPDGEVRLIDATLKLPEGVLWVSWIDRDAKWSVKKLTIEAGSVEHRLAVAPEEVANNEAASRHHATGSATFFLAADHPEVREALRDLDPAAPPALLTLGGVTSRGRPVPPVPVRVVERWAPMTDYGVSFD